MLADFVAALRTEIAALESALAADPRFRKLDLIRRTLALYEDAAVVTLPPEPPSRLAVPTAPVAAPTPQPADPPREPTPNPAQNMPEIMREADDLPPALVQELSRAAQEVAAASEPAPPRLCARAGCGKPIPPERAKHNKVRYCSNECSAIVVRERAAAQWAAKRRRNEVGDGG